MTRDNQLTKIKFSLLQDNILLENERKNSIALLRKAGHAKMMNSIKEERLLGALDSIIAIEKAIIENDLEHHVNSAEMQQSLMSALKNMERIEKMLSNVKDETLYKTIALSYEEPKNQKNGLPYDEARQAFSSHISRLTTSLKARLSDTEKAFIEERKISIKTAERHYIDLQAKALESEFRG